MATIVETFVLREGEEERALIQQCMDRIASKAQVNNYVVDWTTMRVLKMDVDSGNAVVGTLNITGVRVDGSPAP